MNGVVHNVWEQTFGEFGLQGLGVTDADVQRWLADPAFSARLADLLLSYPESDSQKIARQLMGSHFLGPTEAWRYYGVRYTDEQLARLATIPFSEQTLRECQCSHILVAGYPLPLSEIVYKYSPQHLYHSLERRKQFAMRKAVDTRWYLLSILAPDSLSDQEEAPRGCEFVYGFALYYLTGRRLYLSDLHSVQCCEESFGGERFRVTVRYGSGELYSINFTGSVGDGSAPASSRKPEF